MDKFSFRIDSDNMGYVKVNGEPLEDVVEVNIHGVPWNYTILAERHKRDSDGRYDMQDGNILTELVTYHFSKDGDNESVKEIKREV